MKRNLSDRELKVNRKNKKDFLQKKGKIDYRIWCLISIRFIKMKCDAKQHNKKYSEGVFCDQVYSLKCGQVNL